jgi:hypothetical protein
MMSGGDSREATWHRAPGCDQLAGDDGHAPSLQLPGAG